MGKYSETLMDHFIAPRNGGALEGADLLGRAGTPGRGPFVILYLRVRDGRVAEAKYQTHGCGATIAAGSALTELIRGRTPADCAAPAGGITTNTWDYENKLTNVILPSATRNTFTYDADGKRVQKEDSTGTARFLWDLENILLETDNSDVTQAIYTLDPMQFGNLLSQRRSGSSNFFHFDALGSTDRLTSAAEAVTDSYLYKAFGEILSSSGSTANPFKYVGRLD